MSRQGPDMASSEVASDLCAADVLAVGLRSRARAARASDGTSGMAKVSLLGIIAAFAAVSAVVGAGNGYAAHHAPLDQSCRRRRLRCGLLCARGLRLSGLRGHATGLAAGSYCQARIDP